MSDKPQSDLYHVVFRGTVKEDKIDEFLKVIHNDIVETRKEPGCLRTELMRDRDQRNKFYINDIYMNKAAFDYHMTTPHFAQLGAFMESGGVLEQEMILPESLNVEEMYSAGEPGKKEYTLYHFNVYGKGSAHCFMLQKANASWEKKSLTFEEWAEMKKKLGGGIPKLQLSDGTLLEESVPTAKYIGKMFGFYPEDPLLAHRCDYVVAIYDDLFTNTGHAFFGKYKDDAEKKEAVGKAVNELVPKFLDKLEPSLGKMTWLAGEKLSVADFWVGSYYCD